MVADMKILGGIVSFEGHVDTISTQLRLLPTSPQILILPNIQSYISTEAIEDRSDARLYVKRIHQALIARHEAARTFLHGSTPSSKRIVFMNGGTPSAQAQCIKAIMDYETDGDYKRAESLFNRLVKDGLAGLENAGRDWRKRSTFKDVDQEEFNEELEDPITRAMRAADALDRQTASLQPTNELDLTIATRGRSNSLPLYGYAGDFGDAAPFFVFGAQAQDEESLLDEAAEGSRSPRASLFAATHYDRTAERIYPCLTNLQSPSPRNSFLGSASCVGESYCTMAVPISIGPEALSPTMSIPSTDNVVYGEASLLDMRLSGRKPMLARVKSLDRIYPATSKYRDLCASVAAAELTQQPKRNVEQQQLSKTRPRSCMMVISTKEHRSNTWSHIDGPRTIVVNTNRPIIKISPVPLEKKRKPARASYVDRGTDAEEIPEFRESFRPVLPFWEDLVVHFKDEVPDPLLNSVIRGFRAGNFPIASHSPTSVADDANASIPGTPESGSVTDVACAEDQYQERSVIDESSYTDEYDPFAYTQPTWPKKTQQLPPMPKLQVERPPTPIHTPPPLTSDVGDKIHDLQINSQQTAITVQNSLRSVLQDHFPPETQGYRQFQFPLLPELEGLWKPVFWGTEFGSTPGSSHRVDQIVAIGAQRGVKKDYASAITGRLEKLGAKASGMSRSGRLDFRYLLANAMQAYTAQPLTSQTKENPFANSFLLATLIIPHLETYLALHSEVRYLILEYPPEHLSTVLALQKLVGVEMMKVAQIVDANSKDIPFTHLRGNSINGPDQGPVGRFEASLPSSCSTGYDITVSKANFLLTSTASDAEIATFITTISKILSKISDFYIPEEFPRKPSPKKYKPPSLAGALSPFPRVSSAPQSPPMSPALGGRLGAAPPGSSAISSRAPSIAETVKTAKSAHSTKSKQSRIKSKRRVSAADNQSILTVNVDDSDWDKEDQRIMPILEKQEARKGNTRKALKFLGLA
ncbi:hypothetical protein F66182_3892 [Fusarium sp. NRRL 66182]|nr:hypothetical protein F66182_3892 [Fusarium sp. NRRL 66182]